jgi:peroxiredoxin
MIEEGAAAPHFTLPNQDGEHVSLADLRGRPVVLYFYPKADACGSIDSHGGHDGTEARDRDRSRQPSQRARRRLVREPG